MHTLSALEIRDKVVKGELKAVDVTEHFLNRIRTLDPKIGAFLRLLPEKALEKAREVDAKVSRGEKVGLLAGVPIAIKDNIHIRGEISTCASKFLSNYRAPFDSTAARLLAAEDVIFIGKTNMDEFAMGSSTENSAFQKTYNPWDLKCTPGGSSGGSGAAVAARFVPIALGSDTGGSVRLPASFCDIVGYKPTYGRISRSGLVAYGSSLDQIGPMATNVKDVCLLMSILGRPCERDATSLNEPPVNYLEGLRSDLKGVKIGVPWKFLEGLADVPKKIFMEGVEKLKSLGAVTVDVDLDILKYSIAIYYILATAEASTNLARFDGIRYGVRAPEAKTLDEVFDLSKEQGFGAEVKRRILLGTHNLSAGYRDAYYKKAQEVRTLIIQRFQEIFKECDLIAIPTSPFEAFEIGSIQDPLQMYLQDIYTIAANLAGIPAVSLPNGFSPGGKPLGIQLLGPQRGDAQVLSMAYAFETLSKSHIPGGL